MKYSQSVLQPIVKIIGTTHGKQVNYSISDNGIGIPQLHLSTIFELFKRMENAQGIEGSGVGLSIVKRILYKHKATIEAESHDGNGSTFNMQFGSI